MRQARLHLRMSQDEFAAACRAAGWPGCDRRSIQRYESGHVTRPGYQARRTLEAVTGLPFEQLGFPFTDSGVEDPVNRRQLMTLTAAGVATVASGEPLERLRFVLTHTAGPDESVVADLEAATARFFAAEATAPQADPGLLNQLQRHVDVLTWIVPAARPETLRRRLTVAAGEACALAGWLAYSLDDTKRADRWWATAVEAARATGDGPLLALTLRNVAHVASLQGDHKRAWSLLDQAGQHVRSRDHATARAWICGIQADEAAALGDASALVSIDRAMTVMDYADPAAGRAWARFFDNARLGAMAVATYGRLGHPELGPATEAVLADAGSDTKTQAIVLRNLATGSISRGDFDAGCDYAERALAATRAWPRRDLVQRLHDVAPALETASSPTANDLAGRIRALRA
jgi:transcriptional regulator with XRE-family HTH domain